MRLTEPASLPWRQLALDRLRDHAGRSRAGRRSGPSWPWSALRTGPGIELRLTGQRGVAGAGRPRGGGHRPLGAVGRVEHHVRRRPAARGGDEAVDRGRPLERRVALHDGRLEALRAGDVLADPDHLGVLGQVRALGVEPVERVRGHRRQVAPVGQQQRRADRRPGQHRRRDRALPVLRVDEHDGGRAVGAAGGREQGARDAGRVGGGVRARDPDRVARGGRREVEPVAALV